MRKGEQKMLGKYSSDIKIKDDKSFLVNLYENYYHLVYKKVYSITDNSCDTDDLVNDTFIKLIEKVSLLMTLGPGQLTTYIVYTAKSVAINYIKRRGVQSKYIYIGGENDLSHDIPDYMVNLDEILIINEQIEGLSNALLKLPDKYKDLLYYKYFLDKDNVEIANIFSITPDSVRQYLTRARREVKKIMEKDMVRSEEANIR